MKGWKTMATAVAIGLTAILADEQMKQWVMENFELTGASLAFIMGILRLVTNSPVFNRSNQ